MAAAVAIYEAAGFRRHPVHDFDVTSLLGLRDVRPVPILAYRLDLTRHEQQEQAMHHHPSVRIGEMYEHPVTGERAVVRIPPTEANGHLLVTDLYLRPGGRVAGEHVHPVVTEAFTPVHGRLAVRHDGRVLEARPGTGSRWRPAWPTSSGTRPTRRSATCW